VNCPKPLRDAGAALSLLTVMPTGRCGPDGEHSQAAAWFPAVGLAIGAVLYGATRLIQAWQTTPRLYLLIACLLVLGEALLTRLLHYDGLADCADAWWGGATVERRLEIMKDSATGAFGATALVFATLLQVLAVSMVLQTRMAIALLVIPALARTAATCAAWLGRPARTGGLGRSVMGRPSLMALLTVLATLVLTGTFGWLAAGVAGAALCALGAFLALAVPHLISLRMGGVTGDVMGASVLVTQVLLLIVAAVLAVLT